MCAINFAQKRQTVTFHDVCKIGNVCFVVKRKPCSDSQKTEHSDDMLFDKRTEKI